MKKDIVFLPLSGLLGHNIKDKVPKNTCTWYSGPTLFDLLDNADPLPRDPLAPFRMSVIDRYKDMGTIAMGKSESGIVRKGDRLYVMPNKSVLQHPHAMVHTCACTYDAIPSCRRNCLCMHMVCPLLHAALWQAYTSLSSPFICCQPGRV